MYIRMVKKQRLHLITIIIILFLSTSLYSQVSVITLGEEDLWNNTQLTNLSLVEGKRGFLDLTNSDNEYKSDKYTDMILHFNKPEQTDESGNYTFLNQKTFIKSAGTLGGGSVLFDGSDPLLVKSNSNAIFSPSTLWDDFTLEFRILPATLKEGSTVFLWKGLQMKESHLIAQEIRCTISNRKLVWDFENFFINPDNMIRRISLSGDKLIPGIWSHHMITFNSETGLLEYKINNVPVDNIYTSKTGRESLEFNVPHIGNQQSFPIELGENFSGLMDEFRISKRIIDTPILYRYSTTGYMETDILDLKKPDSLLINIETESSKPGNASIHLEYAISNNKFDLLNPDLSWTTFESFNPIMAKGRFVKVRAQLYSETAMDSAPVLSNIKLFFNESKAPAPPLTVRLENMGNAVKVRWEKSIDPEIKGYLVYYGEEPGNYFSMGSPIDSGQENSIILDTLKKNKRYYIAVTSYRSLEPRLESFFSQEVSIIP